MRVIVTRAFLIGGARQEIGSEIEVGDAFARELIQTGRVVAHQAAAPVGPMTTETAPDLVPGKKAKGKSNARKSGTS